MAITVVDPVTRIEGHLGVSLSHNATYTPSAAWVPANMGAVTGVEVYSTMYRGFENVLEERDPRDAIQITQRI